MAFDVAGKDSVRGLTMTKELRPYVSKEEKCISITILITSLESCIRELGEAECETEKLFSGCCDSITDAIYYIEHTVDLLREKLEEIQDEET